MYARSSLRCTSSASQSFRLVASQCRRQCPARFFADDRSPSGGPGNTLDTSPAAGLGISRQERAANVARQMQELEAVDDDGNVVLDSDLLEADLIALRRAEVAQQSDEGGVQEYDDQDDYQEDDPDSHESMDGEEADEEEFEADEEEHGEPGSEAEEGQATMQQNLADLEHFGREIPVPVPFEMQPVSHDELLRAGRGISVVAGGNEEGVIADHIYQLSDPRQRLRYAPQLAKRMLRGRAVSFKSHEEKAQVEEAARLYNIKRNEIVAKWGLPPRSEHRFSQFDQYHRRALVDRLVRGRYSFTTKPWLPTGPVADRLRQRLTQNPLYLSGDSVKFVGKVAHILGLPRPPRPAPARDQKR